MRLSRPGSGLCCSGGESAADDAIEPGWLGGPAYDVT